MEQDVILNIRVSAEMKKALKEHAKNFYGLSASQVVRFLIDNELSDEGVKLNGPWITRKTPDRKNAHTTQGVQVERVWSGSSSKAKRG